MIKIKCNVFNSPITLVYRYGSDGSLEFSGNEDANVWDRSFNCSTISMVRQDALDNNLEILHDDGEE